MIRNNISRSLKLCCGIPAIFLLALDPAAQLSAQETFASSPDFQLQLDTMPTGQLVVVLMRDIMRVPYVIAPEVLQDRKPMSVNLRFPRKDLPVRVVGFLRSIGLTVKLEGGTVFVSRSPKIGGFAPSAEPRIASIPAGVGQAYSIPQGNPLAPAERSPVTRSEPAPSLATASPAPTAPQEPDRVMIVRPANRSIAELANALRTIIPELTVAARGGIEPTGDGKLNEQFEPDELMLRGTMADLSVAKALIAEVDRPRPMVTVRAVVFEYRENARSGGAMAALASLLGGKVQLGLGSTVVTEPGGFVRIATGGLSAVLSATSTDGRFQVLAEPSVTALSGSTATLNSGAQVPTIGELTFTDDGQPIRSVVYRDSGIILRVRPVVRAGGIELQVEQERSSFAKTDTGVDDTPTLNSSSSSTVVHLAPGETVAVAALDETSSGNGRSGFLGGLLNSRSKESAASQLVVLLSADIAAQPLQTASASFVLLDLPPQDAAKGVAE